MMHKIYCMSLFFFLLQNTNAQHILTLQQAIDEALSNNFQIKIARNELEIAAKSNYGGAAGMRPNISLNLNDNPAITNIDQEFANGQTITQRNVLSNNFNANIALNYTLFDGMKMFATRNKLMEIEKMGRQKTKSLIQNSVSNVIQAYSNLVKEQSNLQLVKQTLQVSNDRLQLVKVRHEAGLANNTDIYLAQLDLDARLQVLLNQKKLIETARISLNALLNFAPDSTYDVDSNINMQGFFIKKNLDEALAQNPEILIANNQQNIALQSQKEFESAKYPTVKLNALYAYNLAQSQAGFALFNQSNGPQAGISLALPLYTGNINQHNIAIAKLQSKNAELYKQQTNLTIKGLYEQAWINYTTTLEQVANDEKSVKIAAQYLELMQLRYKSGQSTVLDFREAQRSFEETNARLINYKYVLKLAETDLMRLTGQLVK